MTKCLSSFAFNPAEMGILDRYVEKNLLFSEAISPTLIFLAEDKIDKKSVVKKVIVKDKLLNE